MGEVRMMRDVQKIYLFPKLIYLPIRTDNIPFDVVEPYMVKLGLYIVHKFYLTK